MTLWGILLLAAAAAAVIFLIAPALVIFFAVFHRKEPIPFEQYDWEKYKTHYYVPYVDKITAARSSLQTYPHNAVTVVSYDGLRLYGEYYDQGSDKTAVLFHGIGAELYTNLSAQALFLLQRGFNVLLACHRAHGNSEGRWTTIGLREQYDVLTWTQWAAAHGGARILLYGVSMGAASVMYASDKLGGTNVRAMVIDSGYVSVYEQMKRDAAKMHIPKIMVPAQRLLVRLLLHADIRQPTTAALSHTQTPAFFLHGSGDETVEPRWAQVNFEACAAPKELLLIDGAPHTLSILTDSETTEKKLTAFLGNYFN